MVVVVWERAEEAAVSLRITELCVGGRNTPCSAPGSAGLLVLSWSV